jgi:PAS domain S-box-containing protein
MAEEQPSPAVDVPALQAQLVEALETLRAIREGEVDALLLSDGAQDLQVYTLSSADRPYRLFVETMRDGAATVSESGVVLYANQRLAEVLGVPLTEIVGEPLASFVPARYHDAVDRYRDGGSSGSSGLEMEVFGRDRQLLWVRVGASTLEVDGEQMLCLTFADLTQSRHDQAALAHAHHNALQALRARSQFVANMSHEIRTPLNGVIGMTSLMLATELTDEQREYGDGVRVSGDALMAVVDQILDFSKLDAGNLQLEDIPFEPLTVLEEACAVVAVAAHAKGVELLSEVVGALPPLVSGDWSRLRQVLTNLLTNAVKFTAAGHVCTTVSAEPELGRWRLRFTVRDTGIGVAPQSTHKIFESFSQADGSTTRRYGGTGLGLAISKQLVELMGGEIGVRSAEGQGSSFWFTLLVGAVEDAVPAPPLPPLDGSVLLVDDSAMSRGVLERHLRSWGLDCTVAVDGRQAIELYEERVAGQGTFDVLVVDCAMPGVSGIEVAEAVRRPRGPEEVGRRPASIVMLMISQRERAAAVRAGVDYFASKPIRQDRLRVLLAQALLAGRPSTGGTGTDHPRVAAQSLGRSHLSDLAAGGRDEQPDGAQDWVLLVEDNEINQRVAARMLEKRGYRVEVAPNGLVGLERLPQRPFVAVFMDCHMPVLDGYQATMQLRRLESGDEHVPVIAMTANTVKGDREKCLSAGMDDYLGKPISGAALDAAIARTVRHPGPGPQLSGDRDGRPWVEPVTTAVLDPSTLEELCHGDLQLQQDIVAMFVNHLEVSLGDLTQAMDHGDDRTIFTEAHQLKGSSGSIGALRIAELSELLCRAGQSGQLDDAPRLLQQLRDTTTLTLGALASMPGAAAPAQAPLGADV